MAKFIAGFLTATVIWVVLIYVEPDRIIDVLGSHGTSEAVIEEELVETTTAAPAKKGTRRKGRRNRAKRNPRTGQASNRLSPQNYDYDTEEGMEGDDLDTPAQRELQMGRGGGEEQLSEAEIDRGINSVFKGIERCLLLVPSYVPATGKVIFGMHIDAATGHVTKINLKGPKHLIGSESGSCFRRIAKSIRYHPFSGPDMIVHYPVVFE